MEFFNASGLRFMAHLISFGLAVAVIGALVAARGKPFNMRHWRLLCATMGAYAVWFFMLAISLQDAEFIRRGNTAWLFGLIELAAAGTGWAWYGLTMRASFYIARQGQQPPTLTAAPTQGDAGDKWLQAQVS